MLILPLSNKLGILILHWFSLLTLMIHWYFNSDACFLSLLEAKIRNINVKSTIFYSLVLPFYNITEKEYSKIVWLITIILFSISTYKILHHNNYHKLLLKIHTIDEYIKLLS
jgi:hypothetical protein